MIVFFVLYKTVTNKGMSVRANLQATLPSLENRLVGGLTNGLFLLPPPNISAGNPLHKSKKQSWSALQSN